MRIVTSCLALILVALAVPVLSAEPPAATAVVCTSVSAKGSCEGSSSSFTADVGKLFGFSQVTNVPDKIVHLWFYKDKYLGKLDLPVKGARYKVWSTITVAKNMAGPWRLEARDGSGNILATFNFNIQ